MNTFDPNELIDPSWVRQRGPVERNIYIRSNKLPPTDIEPRRDPSILHAGLILVCAAMFGIAFMALYAHALERSYDANPFFQTGE